MTSGGNSFNDFPEIVPTGEITTKAETRPLLFSFSRPWPWASFLNGSNAAASTAPSGIRHWIPDDEDRQRVVEVEAGIESRQLRGRA